MDRDGAPVWCQGEEVRDHLGANLFMLKDLRFCAFQAQMLSHPAVPWWFSGRGVLRSQSREYAVGFLGRGVLGLGKSTPPAEAGTTNLRP